MRVNTLIIGAAKAGTTSLASWLDEHPACCMSRPKETMFFGADRFFSKGPDWYHSEFFDTQDPADIYCDATPAYSNRDRHPGVPERVYSYNPDMKLVYMIRHPLRRVVSAWQMYASFELPQKDPFENAIVELARQGFGSYVSNDSIFRNAVSTSMYKYQIDAWLEYFSIDQVHFVFLEDLQKNEKQVLANLCDFLHISSQYFMKNPLLRKNTGQERTRPTRLRRWIEGSVVKSIAKSLLPSGVRRRLADSSLGLKPVRAQPANWEPELRSRFVKEIQDDLHAFLALAKRDNSYYPLTPTVKIQTDRLPSD